MPNQTQAAYNKDQEDEIGRIKRLIRKRNHNWIRKNHETDKHILEKLDAIWPERIVETPLPDVDLDTVDCPVCSTGGDWIGRCNMCQGMGRVSIIDIT